MPQRIQGGGGGEGRGRRGGGGEGGRRGVVDLAPPVPLARPRPVAVAAVH